jgi:hypothetical protein
MGVRFLKYSMISNGGSLKKFEVGPTGGATLDNYFDTKRSHHLMLCVITQNENYTGLIFLDCILAPQYKR